MSARWPVHAPDALRARTSVGGASLPTSAPPLERSAPGMDLKASYAMHMQRGRVDVVKRFVDQFAGLTGRRVAALYTHNSAGLFQLQRDMSQEHSRERLLDAALQQGLEELPQSLSRAAPLRGNAAQAVAEDFEATRYIANATALADALGRDHIEKEKTPDPARFDQAANPWAFMQAFCAPEVTTYANEAWSEYLTRWTRPMPMPTEDEVLRHETRWRMWANLAAALCKWADFSTTGRAFTREAKKEALTSKALVLQRTERAWIASLRTQVHW